MFAHTHTHHAFTHTFEPVHKLTPPISYYLLSLALSLSLCICVYVYPSLSLSLSLSLSC